MLFWFQIAFCSTQIFEFNYLVDLENSSNYLKAFENKGLCENEEIQRKTQEMTKTENKYLDENPFDSNLLNDLADFIEENLNSMYKNVDYDLLIFRHQSLQRTIWCHLVAQEVHLLLMYVKTNVVRYENQETTQHVLKFQTVMKIIPWNILTLIHLGAMILIYYYKKIKMI